MVTCWDMLRNLGRDARQRGCWSALLYPKVAPEWYARMVGGMNAGDVHQQPLPEGSLLLLGYVSLAVPDLETTDIYWIRSGVACGKSLKQQDGKEIRANLGSSQLRFPLAAGAAQRWPGEMTLWVDDIRDTTDKFNMLGNTLGTDIVNQITDAQSGGEFTLILKDPFRNFFINVTEAPMGFATKLRKLGHDLSEGDEQYPPKVFNPVAVSDVTIFVPSREAMLSVVRFYNHFLLVPMRSAGPTQYQVQLHLGPGHGLHQTVTFRQDAGVSYNNIGSICYYVAEKDRFVRSFARCKAAGLLADDSAASLQEAERRCEFKLAFIQDPETKANVVPMQQVVRSMAHDECPLSVTSDLSQTSIK